MAKKNKGKQTEAETKAVEEAVVETPATETPAPVQEAKKEPAKTKKAEKPTEKTAETKTSATGALVVKRGERRDYEPAKPTKAPPLKIKPISLSKPEGKTSANAAHLDFPSDRWGLTKDLRQAIVQVASRIAGAEDKKALVDETLKIGMAHIEAKFERDNEYRKELKAKAEAEAELRAKEREEAKEKSE